MPALYETVVLKSSRMCRITLKLFKRRPELCQYVKKLAVRPNYYLSWPKPSEHIEEDWVAGMVEEIAHNLTRLQVFDWDGLEMPCDSLWATLKEKWVLFFRDAAATIILTNLGAPQSGQCTAISGINT
jgi:hypothetical protein